jgi:hypothetical protein
VRTRVATTLNMVVDTKLVDLRITVLLLHFLLPQHG